MRTGWIKDHGYEYYLKASGAMAKNEWIDGDWYYFNLSGYMKTGWILDNGEYYYLKPSGEMARSEWVENRYYVNKEGKWVE